MAQPEPVATATAGAVWSQQPARPWPHKAQEGGIGGSPVRHKSESSMPLTPGRRFMGLLRAHWMYGQRGEDLPVPTAPGAPAWCGLGRKRRLGLGAPPGHPQCR